MSGVCEARHAEQVARLARIARTIAEYHAVTGIEFRVTCEANTPMADELNRIIGQQQAYMQAEAEVFAEPVESRRRVNDGTSDRVIAYLKHRPWATTAEIAHAMHDDAGRISSVCCGLRSRGLIRSGPKRDCGYGFRASTTWGVV